MKYIDGSVIKIGDRCLLTAPSPGYSIGHNNPAVGTQWECVGIYRGTGTVHWENGSQNGYKNGELSKADGCISIWNNPW